MKDGERKVTTCVVVVACFACVSVIGARRYEYLDELCRASSSPSIHLAFHMPTDHQALVLSLSQAEYPVGLNCCLTIISDSYIAAELSEVNLRRNEHCIDYLQVVTQTELMSLCNQEDQVRNDPDDASRTVESKVAMKISFISNSSADETMLEESQALGFTVRILTFIKEEDEAVCRNHYHGFLCPRLGRCLPPSVICDGEEDCYTGKDESAATCGDSTDPPLSASSFYSSPSILSVVLAVISTAFLLCICFWLVCASRRLMVDHTDGQIIWNLFGSSPGMTFSPAARFLRNVRPSRRIASTSLHSSPSAHSTTTVLSEVGSIQEQPPPPYESLFGTGTASKETGQTEAGPL